MKNPLAHLAIFGGAPAFEECLHVGRPNIGDRERFLERVNDILDRRWLTNNGSYVQDLEHQVAKMLGVKHCIAICNGTVALEIAIRAAGLAGEVILPSLTFIATAHALQWQGITPVFCDIDPRTQTLDPKCVEDFHASHDRYPGCASLGSSL
jgi:dTDP-4-amino-4,6-dideoxygalactose transaminase